MVSKLSPKKAVSKPSTEAVVEMSRSNSAGFVFNQKKKKALIIFLAVVVIGLALYRYKSTFIVAVVDNRPITRMELNRELQKQYGQETLQNMITQRLIMREAEKQGVSVTDERINGEIDQARKEIEAQGGKLEEYLAMQGQTLESVKEQIKIRLLIEEMLGKDITITDEEAETYFEQNSTFFPEGTKFEEVKDDIKTQLRSTKISEKFQEWITGLRNNSKISNFLQ